jgi:hypothetical protein
VGTDSVDRGIFRRRFSLPHNPLGPRDCIHLGRGHYHTKGPFRAPIPGPGIIKHRPVQQLKVPPHCSRAQELAAGESHVIDNDAFLCCSASVTIDVKMAGSAGAMCVGGQGLFNTEFRGPGMIMYQSMSSMKVAHFLAAH